MQLIKEHIPPLTHRSNRPGIVLPALLRVGFSNTAFRFHLCLLNSDTAGFLPNILLYYLPGVYTSPRIELGRTQIRVGGQYRCQTLPHLIPLVMTRFRQASWIKCQINLTHQHHHAIFTATGMFRPSRVASLELEVVIFTQSNLIFIYFYIFVAQNYKN